MTILRKIVGFIAFVTVSATAFAAGNQLPTVSLTAPANSASFSAGANITVSATASDPDGTVSKVEFRAGTTPLGTVTVAPYTVTWNNVSAGSYSLTAIATDNKGATKTSNAVNITVVANQAPTVSLTAPNSGSVYTTGSSIVLNATASDSDGTVASVQFYNGSTLLGTAMTAPYSITWSSVPAGNYALTAKATDNKGAATTSIVATITVADPPLVVVTRPLMCGSTYAPNTITITADAASQQSSITKVDFLQGTSLLGTSTTAPYAYTWSNVGAGNYSITARATDANGLVTTSRAVTYSVVTDVPPTVGITTPANNATYSAGATVSVGATATTNNPRTIAKVDFYENSALVGTATAAPYTFAWNPSSSGSYAWTAVATDDLGLAATSASVQVNVISNSPPSVNITSPSAGSGFRVGTTVSISATAADSDGTVAKVDFFANGTAVGTSTTSPYSASWNPTSAGNVSLTAVATDNLGLATTSATIGITVTTDAPPTVSITAPSGGSAVPLGKPVTITATASDSDGTVSKVDFYAGATLIGTSTAAPYSVNWTPTNSGAVVLTAVATDNAGITTTSGAISITADSPPQVSLTSPASGATFADGQYVQVSATASDSDGTVANITYYADGTAIGSGNSMVWGSSFGAPPSGSHVLTAVATDNSGLSTTSAPVQITIGPAPTITGFTPASATVGTEITINGVALDNGPLPTVTFNGKSAWVTYASASLVKALVPNGAATGLIKITPLLGGLSAQSGTNFAVIPPGTGTAAVKITAANAEPATINQTYSVTVQVTATSGTPTGTVQLGSQTSSCFVTLPATTCTLTGEPAVGEVNLVAYYNGDANFATASAPLFAHITNPTTPTEMCGLDPNTVPNDPPGFVPVNQLSGIAYTPGIAQDITGNGNLSVMIATPANNSATTDTLAQISGTFVGPVNTGITVNGIMASTVSGQFLASNVPLSAGANTITVNATTLPGATASTTATINQGSTPTSPLSFEIDASTAASGIAPWTVLFNMAVGTLPPNDAVQSVTLDIQGDGVYTYTATTVMGLPNKLTYYLPGLYTPTLIMIDTLGHTYVAQRKLLIQDRGAQREMLCDVYGYLKDRLNAQDATGAVSTYQPLVRGRYQNLFNGMSSLSAFASKLGVVASGTMGLGYADITVVRDNADQTRSGFPLRMTQGSDGVWRISEM